MHTLLSQPASTCLIRPPLVTQQLPSGKCQWCRHTACWGHVPQLSDGTQTCCHMPLQPLHCRVRYLMCCHCSHPEADAVTHGSTFQHSTGVANTAEQQQWQPQAEDSCVRLKLTTIIKVRHKAMYCSALPLLAGHVEAPGAHRMCVAQAMASQPYTIRQSLLFITAVHAVQISCARQATAWCTTATLAQHCSTTCNKT